MTRESIQMLNLIFQQFELNRHNLIYDLFFLALSWISVFSPIQRWSFKFLNVAKITTMHMHHRAITKKPIKKKLSEIFFDP